MTIVISDCTQYVPLVRTDVQKRDFKSQWPRLCASAAVCKSQRRHRRRQRPAVTTATAAVGRGVVRSQWARRNNSSCGDMMAIGRCDESAFATKSVWSAARSATLPEPPLQVQNQPHAHRTHGARVSHVNVVKSNLQKLMMTEWLIQHTGNPMLISLTPQRRALPTPLRRQLQTRPICPRLQRKCEGYTRPATQRARRGMRVASERCATESAKWLGESGGSGGGLDMSHAR